MSTKPSAHMHRRVTVLVLCVCLSVTTLAASLFILTLKVRYVGGYYRLFLDFNSWILDKTFRSNVMA